PAGTKREIGGSNTTPAQMSQSAQQATRSTVAKSWIRATTIASTGAPAKGKSAQYQPPRHTTTEIRRNRPGLDYVPAGQTPIPQRCCTYSTDGPTARQGSPPSTSPPPVTPTVKAR